MTYIQAKGELLVILDGMTSREQGMAEICPNNPPELSESQCTPNEHSRTGISVVLLAKPHPNNPRLKFKNIVFPVPSYPSRKRKREGKGESKRRARGARAIYPLDHIHTGRESRPPGPSRHSLAYQFPVSLSERKMYQRTRSSNPAGLRFV